eukprot:6204434-Pleurochrysis_carterae.AAC.2
MSSAVAGVIAAMAAGVVKGARPRVLLASATEAVGWRFPKTSSWLDAATAQATEPETLAEKDSASTLQTAVAIGTTRATCAPTPRSAASPPRRDQPILLHSRRGAAARGVAASEKESAQTCLRQQRGRQQRACAHARLRG